LTTNPNHQNAEVIGGFHDALVNAETPITASEVA
jgi:hypothetical protein